MNINNQYNTQAEESILGAIILGGLEGNNNILTRASLSETDFYNVAHRRIYGAMLALDKAGTTIDMVSLQGKVSKEDMKLLIKVSMGTITTANAEHHAEIIKDLSQRRKVQSLCVEVLQKINEGAYESSDEAISTLSLGATGIMQAQARGILSFADVAGELDRYIQSRIESKRGNGGVSGIPSGFKDIDEHTDGFQPGDLIILGGRPSKGKSALGMAIVENAAQKGYPCGVVSIEMGSIQLSIRTLSSLSQVEMWKIRKGFFSKEENEYYTKALSKMAGLPVYFNFSATNITEIQKAVIGMIETHGVKFVILDYLQLAKTPGAKSREREVGEISVAMKHIAKQYNIPVMVLSQLNREVERREKEVPILADLRDCLPAGQRVYVDGDLIPVERCKIGMPVVSLGKSRTLQSDVIKNVWVAGEKEIFRLTTKTGNVIECSDGHKFYACSYKKSNKFGPHQGQGIQGWTELKHLNVGQKIAIVKQYPEVTGKATITPEKAFLLGWIIADGHVRPEGYTEVCTETIEEAYLLKIIADSEFGLDCSIRHSKGAAYLICLTMNGQGNRNGNAYLEWIREIGYTATGSDKHVPNVIFSQPKRIVCQFLRGLFNDGCITMADEKTPVIKLDTISSRLAYEMKHLLSRVGLIGTVKKENMSHSGFKSSVEYRFRVTLRGINVLLFGEKIGFILQNHEKYLRLTQNYKPKVREKKMDIFFDRVVLIEYVGCKETYNIEVRGHHTSLINNSFCVQGFLSHNSGQIEQDADLVMFVYGGAEENLITVDIAKGRNVGLGKVQLYWDKSKMTFKNLQKEDTKCQR